MTSNDFTYKSQDVNYLGFLEAQLRDLQGIATLTYELIQNADDVKDENGRSQTSWMSFDVTDEALIVENNGVFRKVDFERLQDIASGDKRDEIGTTGAFGLGFVSVYQVTDTPEIFSNGIHWIIRPDAPPDQRIQERKVETEGTLFRLPWAFDARSTIRRTLRIEAIHPDQLTEFVTSIGEAIELAALFLRQLHILEVRHNGALVKRIERMSGCEDQIVLQDNMGHVMTWLLFNDDFEEEATRLRAQYPWQIEKKRGSRVRLAIPVEGLDTQGRLFAVLPTDSFTPLPFHINADFYPTTDRKRIHFDDGYQAAWNRAAIQCAAQIVAQKFNLLPPQLGPAEFWDLLQKMAYTHQMADQGELPDVFASFWQGVTPFLKINKILHTSTGQWRLAADVRLLGKKAGKNEVSLLEALNIPIVHPDLVQHSSLMRQPEIGTSDLVIKDITEALIQLGLKKPTPLHEAPSFLRSLDTLQSLWNLIDARLSYIHQPDDRKMALNALNQCAMVLTDGGILERLNYVYHGKPETKALFPDILWVHESISTYDFPGRFVQSFGVRQAVDLLTEMPIDQLENAWRLGRLDLPRLFRWFESQQIEIFADDPSLQKMIRQLPLCPVSGKLRPLAHLYIPGGFEDPLNLAGIVDMEAIGGRRQFLRDLGVWELDFDTYIQVEMPRGLAQNPDLPSDARHQLVQLLADRLGEIRDDGELQEQFGQLPLIACMDGTFRAANVVYASRDVMALLGDRVHIAEPVASKSIRALHRWLGVHDQPTAGDLVRSLLNISKEWGEDGIPLDVPTQDVVKNCFSRLNILLEQEEILPEMLKPLHGQNIIPNRQLIFSRPDHLFYVDRADVALQFTDLDDYLLSPEEDLNQVMAVLGVRPLSKVVQLLPIELEEPVEYLTVQERIADRWLLIQRIVESEDNTIRESLNIDFLENLRVVKTKRLLMQYQLLVAEKRLVTEPEEGTVKLFIDERVLYVVDDSPHPPWAAIARELAMAIKEDRAVGGLAIGIKEVLIADSVDEASHILDELGYAESG